MRTQTATQIRIVGQRIRSITPAAALLTAPLSQQLQNSAGTAPDWLHITTTLLAAALAIASGHAAAGLLERLADAVSPAPAPR